MPSKKNIETLAAPYREEEEDALQAMRYILQLPNVEATLIENEEGRFADAHCILGQRVIPTDQHKRRYMT